MQTSKRKQVNKFNSRCNNANKREHMPKQLKHHIYQYPKKPKNWNEITKRKVKPQHREVKGTKASEAQNTLIVPEQFCKVKYLIKYGGKGTNATHIVWRPRFLVHILVHPTPALLHTSFHSLLYTTPHPTLSYTPRVSRLHSVLHTSHSTPHTLSSPLQNINFYDNKRHKKRQKFRAKTPCVMFHHMSLYIIEDPEQQMHPTDFW